MIILKKIDTPEKAYWLGFLYADGCIVRYYKDNHEIRSMTLELGLCAQDVCHLEKFANALEANIPIEYRQVKLKDKKYDSCRFKVNSTKMCNDLIKLGCGPKKTFEIKLPSEDIAPKELMKYWMEGFLMEMVAYL